MDEVLAKKSEGCYGQLQAIEAARLESPETWPADLNFPCPVRIHDDAGYIRRRRAWLKAQLLQTMRAQG